MAIEYDILYKILKDSFLDDEVILVDTAGDSNHYEVTIISDTFKGLSLIKQHKIVYDAIGEHMGNALHALKINTQSK